MEPDQPRRAFDFCATCSSGYNLPIYTKKESMDLHKHTIINQRWKGFHSAKIHVKEDLRKLRKTRDLHLSVVKPLMHYEEINELMDTILDANGNKISAFKEYLSPEHYRLIRAGVDVKEIKEPAELLAALRKMEMTLESK